MYNKECISNVDEFLKQNNFEKTGLSSKKAEENRAQYGSNIMKQKSQRSGTTTC